MASAVITMGLGGMAYAFHSGGVAECGGCHSMHAPKQGGSFLLLGSDASSTCLNCHQHTGDTGPTSYHISTAEADMPAGTPPLQRTPGGDFGWLKKTYTFSVRGNPITENGETHGHNIYASDYGYGGDSRYSQSPGGSYPAGPAFQCVSCHDPHGKYRRLQDGSIVTSGAAIKASGSYNNSPDPDSTYAVGVYRLLAGNNYNRPAQLPSPDFPGVPPAVAPSPYNRTESSTQTRVAYGHSSTGSGRTSWGQWCGACHGAMHSDGNYVHPVDETLGSGIANIYNQYVNSGNTTGGSSSSSFLSLVPFIENTYDYTTLKSHAKNDDTYLNGPGSNDRVSCLTCHRAHASGWENALRWNMEGEFMTYVDGSGNPVWPGTDTTPNYPQFARGRTSNETAAAYYDRPVSIFGAYQRVLCNKCHAQD